MPRGLSKENNLVKANPELAQEWDFNKNSLIPHLVSPSAHKKVWWKCSKKHSWEATIASRNAGRGCPYCSGKKAGYGNDLKSNHPELIKEWDIEKNKQSPEEFTSGSGKKVYWLCNLDHSFIASISNRTLLKRGCPYCSGKKAGYGNDLKSNHPELIKEWDIEKNKQSPEEFTQYSNHKVWWICNLCKENYKTAIIHRTLHRTGCPYCAHQKIRSNTTNSIGNSLSDLYPEIALEWDLEKNKLKPFDVFPKSHKYAFWICSSAGHSWKARIDSRLSNGCPYCKLTPRSRDELYLLFELKKFFKVSEGDNKIMINKILDVDIKLQKQKIVIEYDGSYWHKDKAEKDLSKTKILQKAGWIVIRVREHPLKILDKKFNVQSKPGDYKLTANAVLLKINELGFKVNDLDRYLVRESLLNKKEADIYIKKLLKEKVKN